MSNPETTACQDEGCAMFGCAAEDEATDLRAEIARLRSIIKATEIALGRDDNPPLAMRHLLTMDKPNV